MPSPKLVISINSTWNFINFRAGLLKSLQAAGYTIVAAAPDDGYARALENMGIEFRPLRMERRGTSAWHDAALLAQYVRLILRERPSAYLSFTIKPNIYGSIAARLCGVPAIANIAGLGTLFLDDGLFNRMIRWLYRCSLKPSRITFFQNSSDMELFVKDAIIDSERARLLPGSGVDLHQFSPAIGSFSSAGKARFLVVARLLWAKGFAEFEEAARQVATQRKDAQFRILGLRESGQGAVDEETIARWRREGIIEYLGSADDVRPAIAEADCVVLPSYYPEGTPRSLLEAAASGRPIITTSVPGCRDVVQDAVNGYCVEPQDAANLAAAMVRFADLATQEKQAMGSAGRRLAELRFDEALVTSAYKDALIELIGPPQ